MTDSMVAQHPRPARSESQAGLSSILAKFVPLCKQPTGQHLTPVTMAARRTAASAVPRVSGGACTCPASTFTPKTNASGSQNRRRSHGTPRRIRTPSLLIRSQVLYPIELWARHVWRRGRDSNPRYTYAHNCLAGSPLQPLGHLSVSLRIRGSPCRRCSGGGRGTRTLKGVSPAVFKTAALPVRSSPPPSCSSITTPHGAVKPKGLRRVSATTHWRHRPALCSPVPLGPTPTDASGIVSISAGRQ